MLSDEARSVATSQVSVTTTHWVAWMVAGASCARLLYAMMRSTLLKRLSNMAADCTI